MREHEVKEAPFTVSQLKDECKQANIPDSDNLVGRIADSLVDPVGEVECQDSY